MSGPAWSPKEISCFLAWTEKLPARSIALRLGRSQPAVMGMRRKLKRLRELDAAEAELAVLLKINEALVLRRSLAEIRRRAQLLAVPVKHYLRRGRLTGKPHLVDDHLRRPVEKGP